MDTWVEPNCTITHEGRPFTAGGALISTDVLIAYLGDQGVLTDWHGNQIGTYRIASSWRINSYLSDRMHQVYATVDGVTYTGRSFGVGMLLKAKRVGRKSR